MKEELTSYVRVATVKLAETELLRCMPSVGDTNSLGSRIPSEVTVCSLSVTECDGFGVVVCSFIDFDDDLVISTSTGSHKGSDGVVVTGCCVVIVASVVVAVVVVVVFWVVMSLFMLGEVELLCVLLLVFLPDGS